MEQKILPVFQVIIAIVFIYLLAYLFPLLSLTIPYKNIIFVSLVSFSIVIGVLAIYSFKRHKTTVNPTKPEATTMIVNTGIYAYSRNPMYLAMLVFLMAICVFVANWLALFTLPLFAWFITKYQIKPEEQALTLLFKEDFDKYIKEVRRWI